MLALPCAARRRASSVERERQWGSIFKRISLPFLQKIYLLQEFMDAFVNKGGNNGVYACFEQVKGNDYGNEHLKNHIGGGSHKDGGEPKVHKRHNCRLNNSTADKSDICVLSVVVLFVDKACKESKAARGGNVHDNAYPAAARAHKSGWRNCVKNSAPYLIFEYGALFICRFASFLRIRSLQIKKEVLL